MKVWRVDHNMQLGPDIVPFDDIYRMKFMEDGKGIVIETESDYDVLYEWHSLNELLSLTFENVVTREFTEEEKKKYYLE